MAEGWIVASHCFAPLTDAEFIRRFCLTMAEVSDWAYTQTVKPVQILNVKLVLSSSESSLDSSVDIDTRPQGLRQPDINSSDSPNSTRALRLL
jgi:hypothetical protein